ncbi:septation protein A [Brachymonas chironomi]|uniref:septation protein A n=1 Tax=Brachymonas chironomi TaxID=491919 RepID=UPI00035F864A|nr:septation protein A [Brachymonas chironomi]
MRQLLDFIPIILFFIAYKLGDIYTATGVLMAATTAQMAIIYAMDRQLNTMQKATLALILIFGALTLILRDDSFIKWKPTVLYTAMAIALGVALWGMRKNVLQMLLGSQMLLPQPVWHRLTIAWIGYCLFMAAINAVFASPRFFTTEQWVDFKLWGYIFPILFVIGQGLYIARHWKDKETE